MNYCNNIKNTNNKNLDTKFKQIFTKENNWLIHIKMILNMVNHYGNEN